MPVLLFFLLMSSCASVDSIDNRTFDQATTCLLADSGDRVVYSVGLGIQLPELHAEYFSNNAISDVCLDRNLGLIFTAGAGIKLHETNEEESFGGGHIASVGITGVPELVSRHLAECTAIECDPIAHVLVFAVEERGIYGSSYDGSKEWRAQYILGSDIQNIFLDAVSQTCFIVDVNTRSIYSLKYMEEARRPPEPIGSAGDGVVGCTLNSADGISSLNIIYQNCRIEKCSVDGPFTGCHVAHPSTGGRCLAVTGTDESITTYDNKQNTIIQIETQDGSVTITPIPGDSSSVISGMDCIRHDFDECASSPCLNQGTCINLPSGYFCECLYEFTGRNCETGPPEVIILLKEVEEFDDVFMVGNFADMRPFFADDAIIDFTTFRRFRGNKEDLDEFISLMELLFVETSSDFELRPLCDICYEDRFSIKVTLAYDPDGPRKRFRTHRVWCFYFDSLSWKIKSLTTIEDVQ